MKQILILFTLSFTLCCNLSAYDVFNFNTTKSGHFLTGTGADVICTSAFLILSDRPIESATYHAIKTVISDGKVNPGDNVTFKAGDDILLLPGFHGVGTFTATIEDCPGSIEETVQSTEDVAESRNQNLSNSVPFTSKQDLKIYPNPFSYTATIDFQLPEEQKVHLAVYSSTQQLIKVLEPYKTMPAGSHQYEISGENLVGGMYFVVLKTEDTSFTKKLILVK